MYVSTTTTTRCGPSGPIAEALNSQAQTQAISTWYGTKHWHLSATGETTQIIKQTKTLKLGGWREDKKQLWDCNLDINMALKDKKSVEDGIFYSGNFEQFLWEKVKVIGKMKSWECHLH